MASPYNAGRYNLVGFNTTPTGTIYAAVTITEQIGFIAASTVNNVYPKARLYETINKQRAQLVPGRFAEIDIENSIDNTRAALIGCSWRKVTTSDSIIANVTGLRQFWRKVTGNDALGIGRANIIGAYWDVAAPESEIDCSKAEMIGCSWRQISSSDQFDAEIYPSIVVFTQAQTNDAFTEQAHLSEQVFQAAAANDAITGRFILGFDAFTGAESYDLIDAHCDVMSQEILTCILTTALGPGQTMVIDAGTYNVLIDGENAVYTHSGDWLDELNRNTQNFTINAASGVANLSATILYTERYL